MKRRARNEAERTAAVLTAGASADAAVLGIAIYSIVIMLCPNMNEEGRAKKKRLCLHFSLNSAVYIKLVETFVQVWIPVLVANALLKFGVLPQFNAMLDLELEKSVSHVTTILSPLWRVRLLGVVGEG